MELSDAHTCMRDMSSMWCGACDRGVPYYHLTFIDIWADWGDGGRKGWGMANTNSFGDERVTRHD